MSAPLDLDAEGEGCAVVISLPIPDAMVERAALALAKENGYALDVVGRAVHAAFLSDARAALTAALTPP